MRAVCHVSYIMYVSKPIAGDEKVFCIICYYLPISPPVQCVPCPSSCHSGGPAARPDTAAVEVTRPALLLT